MELYVGGCGQDKLSVVLESMENCRKREPKEFRTEKSQEEIEAGKSREGTVKETDKSVGEPKMGRDLAETEVGKSLEEQGKTSSPDIYYGEDTLSSRVFRCQVINHFHLIVKKLPSADIELFLEELYEKNPDVIIICDEVGNGIVPAQKEERLYREQVGRSCQWLAARSRRVVRIVCGCMQVLKEDTP